MKITDNLPAIKLHDSQACVYAGTSYSMCSGKPAIVFCNGIEESLRACSGALTPWGDKIPLFILCAVRVSDMDIIKDSFNAVSRRILMCPDINYIDTIPDRFSEFPVTVIFSEKIQAETIISKLMHCAVRKENNSGHGLASEVINEIEKSQKPVILAGRGCINTIENVLELAEKIKAPVLLTSGATTLPVEKIELLGNKNHLIIPSGNPVWLRAFVSADLIIALGTAFSEVDWFGLRSVKIPRGKIFSISNQILPQELADVSLRINLDNFFSEILKIKECPSRKFYDLIVKKSKKYREILKDEMTRLRNTTPLHPSLVAHEIVERSPSGTIFVSEGGACGMWLWMHLWLRPFVFPVQNGTIGVSIPMALGAKLSYPDRKVWAVMGDGAFFYNLNELDSLKKHSLPAVVFVFNDSSWGAIRLAQTFIYNEEYTGTDIIEIDYAKIAEIYGVEGIRVKNHGELISAIEYAGNVKNPLVVDVKIKRDCVPLSGASFVTAEFDGVLRWLVPGLITSSIKNFFHKKIPFDVFRIIRKSIL